MNDLFKTVETNTIERTRNVNPSANVGATMEANTKLVYDAIVGAEIEEGKTNISVTFPREAQVGNAVLNLEKGLQNAVLKVKRDAAKHAAFVPSFEGEENPFPKPTFMVNSRLKVKGQPNNVAFVKSLIPAPAAETPAAETPAAESKAKTGK